MNENIILLEKALELSCNDACDEQCPADFHEIDWEECGACIVGKNSNVSELYYDIDRDRRCWKRYYFEKAKAELEI